MKDELGSPIDREAVKMALMQQDIGYIKAKMDDFGRKIDTFGTQFVTIKEFQVVKMIVFGMVGTILTAFIIGLLLLVFKNGLVK